MTDNKKGVQRGCAKRSDRQKRSLSKAKAHRKNKSVKQRGGDLHKMYNYNNLQVDPQRMMTMDKGTTGSQTGGKGTVQTGGYKTGGKGTDHKGTDHKGTDHKGTLYNGIGGKHRHSRKYYKRSNPLTSGGSALNFSAIENLVHKATTAPMFNNTTTVQTNMKVPAHV